MPVKQVLIVILTIFTLYSAAQTPGQADIPTYDFDTTLRAGYHISFTTDDSLQYLFLKKGNQTIAELSSMSKRLPYKNLGYIGADYTHYFVLVHSYGGGNPRYIQLFKKSTGKNLLNAGAAMIAVDERQEYLLYSENDVPGKKDKMTLLNIRTGQKEQFPFPAAILNEPQVLNRISISRLNKELLVINYQTENGNRTKQYKR